MVFIIKGAGLAEGVQAFLYGAAPVGVVSRGHEKMAASPYAPVPGVAAACVAFIRQSCEHVHLGHIQAFNGAFLHLSGQA